MTTSDETRSKRDLIVEVAMRHFAEHGYRGARVEDIAAEVGVAKGTVFLHFGSKEGLFLAAYERAVRELPSWLEAPAEVVERRVLGRAGLLDRADRGVLDEAWVPNRVAMIGRYDTGLGLRRPIDRFMRSEDPYGTLEFVEFGVRRGEIRGDVDVEMIASMLDWLPSASRTSSGARSWTRASCTASRSSPSGARHGSASSSRCCARASRRLEKLQSDLPARPPRARRLPRR